MIRREYKLPDGSPGWLLISQIEHARLAFNLAQFWQADLLQNSETASELLETILRHDEGWADWEADAQVNPTSGKPYNFTEMPLEESLTIWRKSIATGKTIGLLSAALIANHFCELLKRGSGSKAPAAQEFLSEFRKKINIWSEQWASHSIERSTSMVADALRYLQFFDILSLWFCCREETEPVELSLLENQTYTITPRSATEINISPWPLSKSELLLSCNGCLVAQRKCTSSTDFANADVSPVFLEWKIQDAHE